MVPINTDSILSMVLCEVRSAARACPVMKHKLVISTCDVKLRVSMRLMCYINLYHFFTIFTWQVWGFKGCQWVQKTLLVSKTANTVTSATQTHLKLQENHPKFLWAHQRQLPPSKSVRSQFFFSAFCQTPLQPLVWDPCSATPLPEWIKEHQNDIVSPSFSLIILLGRGIDSVHLARWGGGLHTLWRLLEEHGEWNEWNEWKDTRHVQQNRGFLAFCRHSFMLVIIISKMWKIIDGFIIEYN